jgi:hypothetical protein
MPEEGVSDFNLVCQRTLNQPTGQRGEVMWFVLEHLHQLKEVVTQLTVGEGL